MTGTIAWLLSKGGGGSSWFDMKDKPFETLSTDFEVEDGELKLNSKDTADLSLDDASAESISGEATTQAEVNKELVDEIRFIESKPDVSDIVQCYDRGTDTTKTDIAHYDLTQLFAGDIVKVLIDETHDDKVSYYKVIETALVKSFSYIGSDKVDEKIIETTYANLKAKVDNRQLVPGQSYRITDYVTKLGSMTYAMSAGGNWKVAKSMEQPFDLIVTAITPNKLNENAKAVNHPGAAKQFRNPDGWTIKYDINNNIDKYNWADTTSGKGVIWYMEDDYGNVAFYDFKNVVYQRAKVLTCPFNPRMVGYYVGMPKLVNTSPAHGYQIYTMPYNPNTAYGDATLDLNDTVWLYTWNGLNTTWSPLGSQDTLDATEDITTLCGGNKMFTPAQQYQSGTVNDKIILPNTVFSGSPRMTYMGYRCLNNTLMQVKQSQSSSPGTMYSVRLRGLNYAVTILNNAYAIELDDECYYITAYSSVYAKFMKYSYGLNIIGGSYNEYYRCRYVTIGQIGTTNSYGHKICYDLYGSQTNNVTLYKDGASDNNPEIINGTSSQTATSEHSKFLTTKDYLRSVFENTTRETIYNTVGGTNHEVGYSTTGGCKWSSSTESPDGATGAYYTFQLIVGGAGEGATIIASRTSTGKTYISYRQGTDTWTAWAEMGTIEEFSPSEAFADGTALKISTVETNAKAVVYDGKWLELNTYFASSVSQSSAGWVSAVKVNPNFKYKIDTTRQSRTLGSMWAGGAYVNTAFSRLTGGDIGMYYYGNLLNQTGGVNAMLRIPVVLK